MKNIEIKTERHKNKNSYEEDCTVFVKFSAIGI